jgi:hypothetical protein
MREDRCPVPRISIRDNVLPVYSDHRPRRVRAGSIGLSERSSEPDAAAAQIPGITGTRVRDERKRLDHHSKPRFGQGDDRPPRGQSEGERRQHLCADRPSRRRYICRHVAAADGGADLRNPTAGTPLLQAKQTIGIDLPLKVLAWEDASGNVWITYNDPAWLAARHSLGEDTAEAVGGLARALAKFAGTAAAN